MSFAKLTVDKPIPVSPLIALDRERCILCYRCTRFSEEVSEDGQLIARNRGAQTEIATFEDEPYRSPFSGNVVELCPVGALTSTLYRFDARPWDIQNVPTVCTGCGVGCSTSATIREGKVKRILSRNHPEVDRGWLCDKGRFSYPHLRAPDRITTPLRRGRKGLAEISWDDALERARGDAPRVARLDRHRVLGLRDDGARVCARPPPARRARRALGGAPRVDLGRARGVPPSAERDRAGGDRRRRRRRPGRRARAGRRPLDQGGPPPRSRGCRVLARRARRPSRRERAPRPAATLASSRGALARKLREAERVVLVWSGPGGGGGARIAELAHALGLEDKPGSGAFHLPAAANPRGVALGWAVAADADETDPEPIELLLVSGDEAAGNADVRALAERANRVVVLTMFHGLAGGWADLILPVDGLARAGRNLDEPRGPGAARASNRPAPVPGRARVDLEARRALRRHRPAARGRRLRRARQELFRDLSLDELGLHAPLPARHAYVAPEPRRRHPLRSLPRTARSACTATSRSSPARPSSACRSSTSSGQAATSSSPRRTPTARGIADGDAVVVRSNGTSVELRARVNRKLVEGVARIADEHAGELHPQVEVTERVTPSGRLVGEPHRGVRRDQPRDGDVRLPHARRAQGHGPDAAALRAEPRRAHAGCCSRSQTS